MEGYLMDFWRRRSRRMLWKDHAVALGEPQDGAYGRGPRREMKSGIHSVVRLFESPRTPERISGRTREKTRGFRRRFHRRKDLPVKFHRGNLLDDQRGGRTRQTESFLIRFFDPFSFHLSSIYSLFPGLDLTFL